MLEKVGSQVPARRRVGASPAAAYILYIPRICSLRCVEGELQPANTGQFQNGGEVAKIHYILISIVKITTLHY